MNNKEILNEAKCLLEKIKNNKNLLSKVLKLFSDAEEKHCDVYSFGSNFKKAKNLEQIIKNNH